MLLAALPGCAAERTPDLGAIYSRAAQEHHRNPVVVLPGILGSRLRDADGTLVWGAFGGGAADPEAPDGARRLAVPMRRGAPLEELLDDVRSDGALDRLTVNILGLPIELDAYRQILGALGVGGYRDEGLGLAGAVDYGEAHFTCFQFDYDWRLGIDQNAARLDAFLRDRREYVARERAMRGLGAGEPVRFDIVAHSMGGLVARWFLRYGADPPAADGVPRWPGAELVERAILVGTPNSGSLDALTKLVHGADFGLLLPTIRPALVATMPSVYQLLPRARHGALTVEHGAPVADLLDPALWERSGWGLASDDPEMLAWLLPEVDPAERRATALEHQRKCLERARRVQVALDLPARPPRHLELFLLAGDAEPTPARAWLDPRSGAVWERSRAPGDGTVLRSSALADERVGGSWRSSLVSPVAWSGVTFLFHDHLGLTKAPAFTDNVLYLLLEDPRSFAR